MQLHVGTSGFSYEAWKGPFYPEKLANARMLAYYAERLSAVELNNTFYRLPKRSVLEGWAEQVPPHFRFALKASRRITHFKRLKEADEPLGFLLDNVRVLGERLGLLFFQLPPNLPCDLERLDAFLALLPDDLPTAFEFRHASWECEEVRARLRDRNAALVAVDGDEDADGGGDHDGDEAEDPRALVSTADTGYLRLRRSHYDEAALAAWARRVLAQDWRRAFVFFKHEDEGAAPRMALAFEAAFEREAGRRRARSVRAGRAADEQSA